MKKNHNAFGPKGRSWPVGKLGFKEVRGYVAQDLANDHEKTIGIGIAGPSYKTQRNFVIPTVVDGKQLTEEEAVKKFYSGQNKPVGQYSTQVEADREAGKRSSSFKH